MAYHLNGATQYITISDSTVLNLPSGDWYIAGWCKNDDISGTGNQYLFAWGTGTPKLLCFVGETSRSASFPHEVVVQFIDDDTNSSGFPSTDDNQPFNSNTNWTHVGVGRIGDDLIIVVDGTTQETFDLSSIATFVGLNGAGSFYFGVSAAPASPWDGKLAEWAKWDRMPSAAERTALANGYAPSMFQDSLSWYIPMIRGLYEVQAGLTVNGTGSPTVFDHPPMIYPSSLTNANYATVFNQNITGVLESATGLYAPTSINLTLNITAPAPFSPTLYVGSILNTGTISAPLLSATGVMSASLQYDQSITAPLLSVTGEVVGSLSLNFDINGVLIGATGTVSGSLVFAQTITAALVSATGIIVSDRIKGGTDFVILSPGNDGFTIITPGTDDFTRKT